MVDVYERSIEVAERVLGGEYESLDAITRTEWWGFKNGYVQGYLDARADMRESLGLE